MERKTKTADSTASNNTGNGRHSAARNLTAGFLADRQFVFLVLINLLGFMLAVALAGTDFVSAYNLQSMAAQLPELGLPV